MHGLIDSRRVGKTTGLIVVDAASLAKVTRKLGKDVVRWVRSSGFRGDAGSFCPLPDAKGQLQAILVGISDVNDIYALSSLPQALPAGDYHLDTTGLALDVQSAALGWGLAAYRFLRYRKGEREPARLAVERSALRAATPLLKAVYQVRDLVNTPTQDMGPEQLADAIRKLATGTGGAKYRAWIGEGLLKANFPTIHAVGRASHREPRLVELTWGRAGDPLVAVVGKGVCFDSGGLNMKSADGMRWMKKDMGGAAHAIALAGLIMQAKLPVRLMLLVPAVENSVAGNAYRPGEVIRTRAGIHVEVDNTDAEGRLVLCDALAYAVEHEPDLIVDFATLTGAARIALGPELPALFGNDDAVAVAALQAADDARDPLWRMPLWQPYLRLLDSRIADVCNSASSRMGGAITAALYLQRFVPDARKWLHLDVYAWNDTDRPGRPRGGEAMGLRALFAMLSKRYARSKRATRKR